MKNARATLYLTTFLVLISPLLYANAGVPMLVIAWPIMGIALIPVVLIEWLSLRKSLPFIAPKRLLVVTGLSNIFSTVVGIPLAWFVMFGVLFLSERLNIPWNIPLGAAWVAPYEGQMHWIMPLAFLVLLIPFFWASYWLEAYATKKFLKDVEPRLIKKAVFKANIWSYTFLVGLTITYLIFVLMKH